VTSITDNYERLTYDLGTNFRNSVFKSVLERMGRESWAILANAHWPSSAEKSIELLPLELDSIFEEWPTASARVAFAAAATA
jgi:hypothetical protein